MTNGQRTTATLLAVVALLLGLDVYVHRATAQPQVQPHVRLVEAFDGSGGFFARLWSDGLIEEFDPTVTGVFDWVEVPGGAYAPPTRVRAVSLSGRDTSLIRAWSDGTVEKLVRSDDSGPWDTSQWAIVGP